MPVTPQQKRITGLVITAVLLLLAGYDALAMFAFGTDATISRVVLGDSTVTPTIPFGIGFLMGHLFWPQPKP